MIRHHRALAALAALAIVGVAAVLIAPDAVVRGLPFLVLLACPLMMVFMMRPMHQMPAAGSSHRGDDPYSRDALAQRLAELDAAPSGLVKPQSRAREVWSLFGPSRRSLGSDPHL